MNSLKRLFSSSSFFLYKLLDLSGSVKPTTSVVPWLSDLFLDFWILVLNKVKLTEAHLSCLPVKETDRCVGL